MDIQTALKEQLHGGLAMLRQCIERCPDALWVSGTHPRPYWRIAWHTLYFTHNHLAQSEEAFNSSVPEWPAIVKERLWLRDDQKAVEVEPYELPEGVPPLSRSEMVVYLEYVEGLVDSAVDGLDHESDSTGFSWYPNMSKMSHELMNLRHIQGHVGQLSELLMMRGIDIDWIGEG